MSTTPDVDTSQEVLDEGPKNILLGIISQLRKGMDLHRVTLPTFVLEPRSMLERITDFMTHPDLIMSTPKKSDPVERFVDVVRYFLSGWHIRPRGAKKPYNPVLGEIFRCRWKLEDQSESFYVAEQVSHHPPVSCYFYANPQNRVVIIGDLRPKSKFLGNSAATLMHGGSKIIFLDHPGEEYFINLPNVYARGILFGTMFLEMGDSVQIKCPATNLVCDVEFKVKPFFGGTYNSIAGNIRFEGTSETLYELSGKWSDIMYISKSNKKNDKQVFFDASTAKCQPLIVEEEAKQWEQESRRLWAEVTKGLKSKDLDYATDEKTKIEDMQRQSAKHRAEEGVDWKPRFFHVVGDDFDCNFYAHYPKDDAEAAKNYLESIIFTDPSLPSHS